MKKVVASIGVVSVAALGLLSVGPAFASGMSSSQDVSALQARVARMEATLAKISQEQNRPVQQDANWFHKIHVSGGIAADMNMGKDGTLPAASGSSSPTNPNNVSRFSGYNGKRFSLTTGYLNVDANVNPWVAARIGVDYTNANARYANVQNSNWNDKNFNLNQAYVTIANFNKMPYYVKVGMQYLPYGRYKLNPITMSVTQSMSMANATALTAGFVGVNGFNAAAFAFQNQTDRATAVGSTTSTNSDSSDWGVTVGYDHPSQQLGYSVSAGYMRNMTGLNIFHTDTSTTGTILNNNFYRNVVGSYVINGSLNSGPFDVSGAYTSATTRFDSQLQYKSGKNAKPSAYNLAAGYKFMYMNYNNHVGIGYGHSSEASEMGLPRSRYNVDYSVGIMKNTTVALEYSRAKDYGTNYLAMGGQNATGDNYNIFTVRLGVDF